MTNTEKHELRTPLTTMKLYAEMLSSDLVADPEKKEMAQKIAEQVEVMKSIIEKFSKENE